MSSIAIFFLISKTKFEEYCQLAENIFSLDSSPARKEPSIRIFKGTDKLLLQNIKRSQKLRNFLREFGEQPYVFKWNGGSLSDALFWLQKTKNIDLCQIQFKDASGLYWILFESH